MSGHHLLMRWLPRFWRAQAGVAAVEFALILPIMLLVYIGTIEASSLISMDRKVQTASGAVGDLIARSDGSITTAELEDYIGAAGGILTPYSPTPLIQIVTQVRLDINGNAIVDWSRGYVGQARDPLLDHAVNSTYRLPSEIVAIAREGFIIVSEARYAYTPLYGIVFDQPVNLYRENFFLPRFNDRIQFRP
jgi:Flp pilus assembly protein TadG